MAGMGRLILLFVLVPAIELALLIEVGSRIGTLATLGLIAVTGVVGAALARRQGLGVLRRVQLELSQAKLPADSLVDGVIILVAGALLITPGILTDAVGFLCLVPGFRSLVKRALWRRFERAVREKRVDFAVHVAGQEGLETWPGSTEEPPPKGPTVDVEFDRDPRPGGGGGPGH